MSESWAFPIVYDCYVNELQAFQLVGDRYQKIASEPKVWLPTLELAYLCGNTNIPVKSGYGYAGTTLRELDFH